MRLAALLFLFCIPEAFAQSAPTVWQPVADNICERPLSDIWRHNQTFKTVRAYEGGTGDTFSGGCRARSQVFNGSANAPDPWLDEKNHLQQSRQSNVTFYDPLTILQVSANSE